MYDRYDLERDEELRMDRDILEKKLKKIKKKISDARASLKEGYRFWHAIEDPMEKRMFHLELYKASGEIWALERRAESMQSEISYINSKLCSTPSETIGCIYDTPHELDLNDLNDFNIIIGVKLC